MKRGLGSMVFGLLLATGSLILADIPRLINFQGVVTDSRGRPLNGQFELAFAIYNAPTNGSLLWSETHTNVDVDRGAFSVQLGSTTPLSPAFDTSYWLGIRVDGGTELFPRLRLTSAPYSFRAAVADALASSALPTLASNLVPLLPSTGSVPRGVIVMWSGSISEIPFGWALCDGTTNGIRIPDLRDRFVVGAREDVGGMAMTRVAGETNSVIGGATQVTGRTGNTGNNHQVDDGSNSNTLGSHDHDAGTLKAVPPYYALAFIIKL